MQQIAQVKNADPTAVADNAAYVELEKSVTTTVNVSPHVCHSATEKTAGLMDAAVNAANAHKARTA